jgi:hypothetical protein
MKTACTAIFALALAGCGSGDQAETKSGEAVQYFEVDQATAGSVSGKVAFTGAAPIRRAIDMTGEEEGCRQAHAGAVYAQEVVVNPDGTLANVFVWVSAGLEGKAFRPPEEKVELRQEGCMFLPHVVGLRTNQWLSVSNHDPVTHNVHPMPMNNREWNQGQPPGAPEIERRFVREDIGFPIRCNVHTWMRAYGCVVAHPYFFVTGEEGTFELKDLPPGSYTISAWHEKYGTKELPVTLGASGAESVEFTFREP